MSDNDYTSTVEELEHVTDCIETALSNPGAEDEDIAIRLELARDKVREAQELAEERS